MPGHYLLKAPTTTSFSYVNSIKITTVFMLFDFHNFLEKIILSV